MGVLCESYDNSKKAKLLVHSTPIPGQEWYNIDQEDGHGQTTGISENNIPPRFERNVRCKYISWMNSLGCNKFAPYFVVPFRFLSMAKILRGMFYEAFGTAAFTHPFATLCLFDTSCSFQCKMG